MLFSRDPKTSHTPRFWTFLSLALPVILGTVLTAQTATFVSFDAPDAGHGTNQGTFATSINQNGVIAGWYIDSGNVVHAFVRLGNGQITEFDPTGSVGTFSDAINLHGQVVGYFTELQDPHTHGFLRNSNGTIAIINAPGATDTIPYAINDARNIAGTYDDSAGVWHGFLRDPSGAYTVFDAPNAGTGQTQGTTPVAMNANNEITGYYVDANNLRHGFVRDPLGNFSTFDAPGTGTQPVSINLSGEVTGFYFDSKLLGHSFLRDAAGTITTIDMPRAIQTFASGINDQGMVVGEIIPPPPTAFAGFLRSASGKFFAIVAPGSNIGTNAISINNSSRITGYYVDSGEVGHGFFR